MPDHHVRLDLLVVGERLPLLPDADEEAGLVLAPFRRPVLGEHEALGERLVVRRPVLHAEPVHARRPDLGVGAYAGLQPPPGQQGVAPLLEGVRLHPPEDRHRRAVLAPGEPLVGPLGRAQRHGPTRAQIQQVRPVARVVGGVHDVGQQRAALVEGVGRHVTDVRGSLRPEVVEQQVGSPGAVLPVSSVPALRRSLLDGQPAGVAAEVEGRHVLEAGRLLGTAPGQIHQVEGPAPPVVVARFLAVLSVVSGRRGHVGHPAGVAGEGHIGPVDRRVDGHPVQALEAPDEERVVALHRLVGVGEPAAVGRERFLAEALPARIVVEGEEELAVRAPGMGRVGGLGRGLLVGLLSHGRSPESEAQEKAEHGHQSQAGYG